MRTIYGFFVLSICILLSACSTFPYSLDLLKGNSSYHASPPSCFKRLEEEQCVQYNRCVKNYIKNVYKNENINFYFEKYIQELGSDIRHNIDPNFFGTKALQTIIDKPEIAYNHFKGFRSDWKAEWAVKGAKFLLEAERSCRHHLK